MREWGDGRPGKNYSIGAIPYARGTKFRIWAPVAHKVEVVVEDKNRRYHADSCYVLPQLVVRLCEAKLWE